VALQPLHLAPELRGRGAEHEVIERRGEIRGVGTQTVIIENDQPVFAPRPKKIEKLAMI